MVNLKNFHDHPSNSLLKRKRKSKKKKEQSVEVTTTKGLTPPRLLYPSKKRLLVCIEDCYIMKKVMKQKINKTICILIRNLLIHLLSKIELSPYLLRFLLFMVMVLSILHQFFFLPFLFLPLP